MIVFVCGFFQHNNPLENILSSQVVGRVRKGLQIIESLNDVAVGPDSIPFQKVSIIKSGSTNSNGEVTGT